MNRLLIISCSQRKYQPTAPHPRMIPKEIPAIERYDGPTYRCLRKWRTTHLALDLAEKPGQLRFPGNLCVLIISAKFGLIIPDTHISNYDLKMTSERAAAIRHEVKADLYRYLGFYEIAYGGVDEVFINLGKQYQACIEGFCWGTIRTLEASGGIGQKTEQMKAWLERISNEAQADT